MAILLEAFELSWLGWTFLIEISSHLTLTLQAHTIYAFHFRSCCDGKEQSRRTVPVGARSLTPGGNRSYSCSSSAVLT